MAATFTVPTIFKAIDQVTAPTRAMRSSVRGFANSAVNSMKRASISVTNFNRRIDSLHRNINRRVKGVLGRLGSLGAGIGLYVLGREVVQSNIKIDNSLQSLQAITGVTGDAFKGFAVEIEKVSKRQKIFTADTAKAFELVGSAKPELLESAEALGKVTESALILSKAGKLEVVDAVNSLTVSMNQFGAGANKASEFVDILATAQQKGSGTIQYLSEAMVNAGGTSKAFGNSFADTVAILEGFAKAGVPASEAGTMLSGILAKLSKSNKKEFNPQFTKATDIINNLAKANLSYNELLKMTDVRGAKWITTIVNQNDVVQKLTGNLNEVGNAQEQANIQSMSFGILLKEIGAAFRNVITSTDSQNESLLKLKQALKFVADNMGTIVSTALTLIKIFAIYKAATIGLKVVQIGLNAAITTYNIALGINTAIQKKSLFALRGNTVALGAYKGVMAVVTAAQWLYNTALAPAIAATWAFTAALWANPIVWIVAAILALVAAIVLLIVYWKDIVKWVKESDNWFAKLIRFSLIPIIFLFQLIKTAWIAIRDAFNDGGILEGLKQIGKSLLSFLLAPLEAILSVVNVVSGGKIGGETLAKLQNFRKELDTPNVANTEVVTKDSVVKDEKQNNNRLDLYLNNRTSDTEIYTEGTGINVNTTGYGK